MKKKEDILAKWLNGEISDSELEALEGADALRELKQVTHEVDQWSLPKYNTDAGYQKMKGELKEGSPTNSGSTWIKVLVTISIIGLLIYGLLAFLGNQKEVLKADPGYNKNFAFQDGSEVWLNDGSSIEYKTSDWSTQRAIELQGEALFQVSKGSPFTVKTSNGTITVLGTRFNVRAWGDNLYVECYEGKVQVQDGEQLTVLIANQAVNIIAGAMSDNKGINKTSPAWQNEMSRFYDDKLKIVCDELERQYQIKVELKASDRIFSGNFKHDDLEDALRSICKPLNLKYTISQNKKSVVIE